MMVEAPCCTPPGGGGGGRVCGWGFQASSLTSRSTPRPMVEAYHVLPPLLSISDVPSRLKCSHSMCRLALTERSAGVEELCRPAFMVPGQESSAGSLRHVEAHPAHIQAPLTQPPLSMSAMDAYYSSLNESSETSSANEPSESSKQPSVSSPLNEPSNTKSPAPSQVQVSDTDGVKTDVGDQQSASPCQPGLGAPHDDSAGPGQGPQTKHPQPHQAPRPDHPKPQQRNNIVPLPFKVRDKHA